MRTQPLKKNPRKVIRAAAPARARRVKTKARPKRKAAYPLLPMQRELPFAHVGRYFDLKAIFNKLNAKYFRNRLRNYTITWGRKRKERPREYFIFGSIQEEDRIIRIHPLLDRAMVPSWFLDYVMFHEMLHAMVPDRYDGSGRRVIHHEGFAEKERKFHWFRRAKTWEQENLARFLR
jgi:predicted metal-dependent hydrolase